jgi:hypothetical protein
LPRSNSAVCNIAAVTATIRNDALKAISKKFELRRDIASDFRTLSTVFAALHNQASIASPHHRLAESGKTIVLCYPFDAF